MLACVWARHSRLASRSVGRTAQRLPVGTHGLSSALLLVALGRPLRRRRTTCLVGLSKQIECLLVRKLLPLSVVYLQRFFEFRCAGLPLLLLLLLLLLQLFVIVEDVGNHRRHRATAAAAHLSGARPTHPCEVALPEPLHCALELTSRVQAELRQGRCCILEMRF